MPDHLWFVPITGGSAPGLGAATFPTAPTRDLTNVQWNFSVYPVNQQPPVETACLAYTSITAFSMGSETPSPNPSKLNECYGHWAWRSCAQDNIIVTGGQLAVGTVFSRELNLFTDNTPNPPNPAGSYTWDMVEAWVKFRINAAAMTVLDSIFFSINDAPAGPNVVGLNVPPANWIGALGLVPGTWFVAYAFKTGGWTGWDDDNLRAVLSVQGTSNPANVGPVAVDVEWFAFALTTPH